MKDDHMFMPERILSLTDAAAKKIIDSANGNAALLYLSFLRGSNIADAQRELHWPDEKLLSVMRELATMGLVNEEAVPDKIPEPAFKYQPASRMDLYIAVSGDPVFKSLHNRVTDITKRNLSDDDVRDLFEIYDHYEMDPDVICLLVEQMVADARKDRPTGPPPRMYLIKREAAAWARRGIVTVEDAEEYLRKGENENTRERKILSIILGNKAQREPVEAEMKYINQWIDRGYSDDLIACARQRTIDKIGESKWPYISAILDQWNRKGISTPGQVETMDKPSYRGYQNATRPHHIAEPTTAAQSSYLHAKEAEKVEWLDEFLAEQESKKRNGY